MDDVKVRHIIWVIGQEDADKPTVKVGTLRLTQIIGRTEQSPKLQNKVIEVSIYSFRPCRDRRTSVVKLVLLIVDCGVFSIEIESGDQLVPVL